LIRFTSLLFSFPADIIPERGDVDMGQAETRQKKVDKLQAKQQKKLAKRQERDARKAAEGKQQ
jgi:hypothetical protein